MSEQLYTREGHGAISAAGIALLAGVDKEVVLAIPGATDRSVPAVDFPEILRRRMSLNIERASREMGGVTDLYAVIDHLAERRTNAD